MVDPTFSPLNTHSSWEETTFGWTVADFCNIKNMQVEGGPVSRAWTSMSEAPQFMMGALLQVFSMQDQIQFHQRSLKELL